jgi:uncharacterized protein (DUF58 family)
VKIQLTALGFKGSLFGLVLVVAFIGAPYANLFFLLIAFLTILAVLNLWWTFANLHLLRGGIEALEPLPAGAGGPVTAWVEARSRPRFGISLQTQLGSGPRLEIPCAMVSGREQLKGSVPPLPRGIYPLRQAQLTTCWPLGLVRFHQPIDAPESLVVYPAPAENLMTALGGEDEHQSAHRVGGALQPATIREFRHGDSLSAMHWKASARRGEWLVVDWDGGENQGAEVLLDRRTSAEKLEEALSLVSALVHHARDRKDVLGFHSQGMQARYGPGHQPYRELLTYLAGCQPLPETAAPPPVASPEVLRLPLEGARR